jgi:ABC-type proline/glycine betaine transport system permease subunit
VKNHPVLKHLGIAILIWIVFFIVITPFPYNMPHPEDFSSTVWFFAIGMTFYLLGQTGDRRLFWLYLPIPLLAILGFLEEIAWGVELNLFQPAYLEQFDLTVYDAHNFVPAITRIFLKNIGAEQWHSALFSQFLVIDALALAVVAAFMFAIRAGTKNWRAIKFRERVLVTAAWLFTVPSLFALWQLLSLPVDPKNAVLFGYSLSRLVPIAAFALLAIAGIAFATKLKNKTFRTRMLRVAVGFVDKSRIPAALVLVVFIAALLFQLIAPLDPPPDRVVQFERLLPLVGWALAISALFLLCLRAWRGGLRKPVIEYFLPFRNFFVNNPAYIYAVFAIALLLFAQGIDKALIPLNKYIITPNFWVPNWELWIEELSELVAAVELVAGAFFFPYPPYPSLQKEIAKRRK